jgi:hypothetical protein
MMPTMEIIRREAARAGLRPPCVQIEAINVSLLKLPPKPVEHTPLGPQRSVTNNLDCDPSIRRHRQTAALIQR